MKEIRRRSAIGALLLAVTLVLANDAQQSLILGNWLSEAKDGIIQISLASDANYEGRIVGGNHPGRTDDKNPDPAERSKPLRGRVILRDLRYDGEGKWSGDSAAATALGAGRSG